MDNKNHEGSVHAHSAFSGHAANPWEGFAHRDHRSEELEPLQRTLRFASIELNKFWISVNAFPVFMNAIKGASLREIERLFSWLQANPQWTERVQQPRLISDLCKPAGRQAISALADNIRRARELRSAAAGLSSAFAISGVDSPAATAAGVRALLGELRAAEALTSQLGLEAGGQAELQARIDDIHGRLERNRSLRKFFSRVSFEGGLPEATCLTEATRLFQAIEHVRKTPDSIYPWRKNQILGPQQRIRIEAWQDRARPVLEARKRLRPYFRVDGADGKGPGVTADDLRVLASRIREGGLFRAFSSSFKEALKRYQSFAPQDDKAAAGSSKDTPADMAQRLLEWASYLEAKEAFDGNAEAQAFFAPLFRGIDTDFAGALAANAWAAALRASLKVEDPSSPEGHRDAAFCGKVMEGVFTAQAERLKLAAASCGGPELRAVQSTLQEPAYQSRREFAAIGAEEERRLAEATRIREAVGALGFGAQVPLGELRLVRVIADELAACLDRIDANAEGRASLKGAFAGEATDLGVIEQARAYIDAIIAARLPEALEGSFLTSFGPQRLADSRGMVAPALTGLAVVKDHLQRVETATKGQSRKLEELPLLDLIERIQRALKAPTLLVERVEQLRSGRTH